MKALFDRVVVKELPQEDIITDSNILLNKTAIAQAHTRATVIMVGELVTSVKEGDVVLFTSGAGNPILIDGQGLILLRAEQLDVVL